MRAAALAALLALPAAAAQDPGLVLGCNVPVWSREGYGTPSTREKLASLQGIGAGWVALTPTLYVADRRASRVDVGEHTPSDEAVRAAIRAAHARGLKVLLKPHVDLPDSFPRFVINPRDPEAWFKSYEEHVLRYAELAAQERCEMFAVGTELALLAHAGHRASWLRLIAAVRGRYLGPLTYAANSFGTSAVSFWDALDVIGVDAYYPVLNGSVDVMTASWKPWFLGIGALAAYYRKPVVFTEVGIASQKGANLKPWDWAVRALVDQGLQARYYEALVRASSGHDWFRGFLCWDWGPAPGSTWRSHEDPTMNVRGKPAQDVLESAFRRGGRPVPTIERQDWERRRPPALLELSSGGRLSAF